MKKHFQTLLNALLAGIFIGIAGTVYLATPNALLGPFLFAFGLLTFGLFIGYLPGWMGLPSILNSPAAYALVALVSLALLWQPLGREEMKC